MKQVHEVKAGGRNPAREELPQNNFRRRLRNASFALLVAGAMASGPFAGRARAATPEQEKEATELSWEYMKLRDGEDSMALIMHMKKEKRFASKMFKTHKEEVKRGELVKAKKSLDIAEDYIWRKVRLYNPSRYSDWPIFLMEWDKRLRRAKANVQALGYYKTRSTLEEGVKKGSWGESLAANYAREAASKKIEPFDILMNGSSWTFRMVHNSLGEDTTMRFTVEGKSISLSEVNKEIGKYRFVPELCPCHPRKLKKQQKDYVRTVIVRELIDKYPNVEIMEK